MCVDRGFRYVFMYQLFIFVFSISQPRLRSRPPPPGGRTETSPGGYISTCALLSWENTCIYPVMYYLYCFVW